jgi:hypothetical protein
MTRKPMPPESRRGLRSMIEIALALFAFGVLVTLALLWKGGHLTWIWS